MHCTEAFHDPATKWNNNASLCAWRHPAKLLHNEIYLCDNDFGHFQSTLSTSMTLLMKVGWTSSLLQETLMSVNVISPWIFGKYSWHLTLLFSISDVSIIIDSVFSCSTIRQKSCLKLIYDLSAEVILKNNWIGLMAPHLRSVRLGPLSSNILSRVMVTLIKSSAIKT